MNLKKFLPMSCIIIFIVIVLWSGSYNLINFFQIEVLTLVVIGGSALAITKKPKCLNEFYKYFTKTSLLMGILGFFIGSVNMLISLEIDPYDYGTILYPLAINTGVMFTSLFYGLFFSCISYALYRE